MLPRLTLNLKIFLTSVLELQACATTLADRLVLLVFELVNGSLE